MCKVVGAVQRLSQDKSIYFDLGHQGHYHNSNRRDQSERKTQLFAFKRELGNFFLEIHIAAITSIKVEWSELCNSCRLVHFYLFPLQYSSFASFFSPSWLCMLGCSVMWEVQWLNWYKTSWEVGLQNYMHDRMEFPINVKSESTKGDDHFRTCKNTQKFSNFQVFCQIPKTTFY